MCNIFCAFNVHLNQMLQIVTLKIVCTDSTETSFIKLRSAGWNYNLQKSFFFTNPYFAGVSNKHWLLAFFILSDTKITLVKSRI